MINSKGSKGFPIRLLGFTITPFALSGVLVFTYSLSTRQGNQIDSSIPLSQRRGAWNAVVKYIKIMSDSSKRPSLIDKLGSMKQSVRLRGLRKGLHHHSSDQHVQLEKDAAKEDDDCKVAESEDEAGDNFDNRTVAKVTHEVSSQPKGFRWLQLKKTYFIDENGVDREWETAERVTRKSGIPDAVFIIAFLDRGRDEEELLLVSQFRPCVDSYVLEFPAGLVDEGETAEEAALRELREETGYIGSNPHATPIVPADAGMTNSMLQFVQVHVDMSLPENKRPKQELEETESIQTHYVPRSELREMINNPRLLRPGKKIVVDVRLFMFLFGLTNH